MTLAEQGAYIRLLCYQWQDGSIPNVETDLSRLLSVPVQHTRRIWNRISECFVPLPDNPLRSANAKLEIVRNKQLEHSAERSESGRSGAAKRWSQDSSAIIQPLAKNGSSSSSSNKEETVSGFDLFWSTYPKKAGKADALKSWKRIRPDLALQEKISAKVTEFKACADWHRENGRYIPHPATWLNRGGWEDQVTQMHLTERKLAL